ncbi:MAG: peroxiredoxin, partial [Candidatus Kapabacteria bacterium]|nr:peroxiredoxin [Candidatus Kapabacteria bacterium]
MALAVGTKAPNFTLPSTSGKDFILYQEFKNTVGIMYFYPKDFTPACTAEACAFRDAFDMLSELKIHVPVVGISADDLETHQRFRKAHNISFHLLSDADKNVARMYDVVAPIVGFIQRVTFLIDRTMTIAAVHQNLFDARSHIEKMIQHLRVHT